MADSQQLQDLIDSLNKLEGKDQQYGPPAPSTTQAQTPSIAPKQDQSSDDQDEDQDSLAPHKEATQAISNLFAPKPGQSQPPTTDLTQATQPSSYLDTLKQAMGAQAQTELVNRLGAAGDIIGSSIARAKPVAQELFAKNIQEAGQPVKQIQTLKESEKYDPNSTISKAYRDFAGQLAIKVDPNTSAADLEKITPLFEKHMDFKIKQEILKQTKATQADEKTNKDFEKLNEAMDPMKRGAAAFGDQYKRYVQAKQLKALINGPSGLNLNPQQMREFATGLATLIGGAGSKAKSQIDHLVASTGKGNLMAALQWVSNKPTGAGQQEFVQSMLDTVNREQDIAAKEVLRGIDRKAHGFNHLKTKDEDRYNDYIQNAKSIIDQPSMHPSSGYSPKEEAGIAKVMIDHNLSREDAIKELKDLGALK